MSVTGKKATWNIGAGRSSPARRASRTRIAVTIVRLSPALSPPSMTRSGPMPHPGACWTAQR